MKYTVSMATFYNNKWHIDNATESCQMDKQAAIIAGHKLAALGVMPVYREYKNGIVTSVMTEYHGHFEPAFTQMVA